MTEESSSHFLLWEMAVNKPTHDERFFPGSVGCHNYLSLNYLGSVLVRQFSCCSCTVLVKRRPLPLEHRMNEPYSPTTPRPISTNSPSTMKMFMCFLSVFIIAQFIGTVLFCLYLHMKLDKVELEINLHEDYLFLRKIQKCRKPEGADSSFLDCKEIINRLEDLLIKDVNVNKDGAKPEMQKDDRQQPISAHLMGFKNSTKPVSVLQWRKTGYAPTGNLISYDGGKLKVEKEGLYYIYTQVSFCTKQAPGVPFTVFVYLNLPSELDRLLLKGQDTQSSSRGYCALQSTHLGGVFELRQGDVVFVNVTDSTQVNYDPGNTYFGMFKLY